MSESIPYQVDCLNKEIAWRSNAIEKLQSDCDQLRKEVEALRMDVAWRSQVTEKLQFDLQLAKEELETVRTALGSFVSGFDEREIRELRTSHWGRSAGEMSVKDVLTAIDLLQPTPTTKPT